MYKSHSSDPAERAKALLIHYFSVLFKAQGLQWNEDNEGEIASIVDLIVEPRAIDVPEEIFNAD